MAKHNFDRPIGDNAGNIVATGCSRCGKIVNLKDGEIPPEALQEECKREDFSQAAARIVREATKD